MKGNAGENSELELSPDIKHFLDDLAIVQKEYNQLKEKLSAEFSETDKKQQDLLHYIEFNQLSTVGAFRLYKELRQVRNKRRIAEDKVGFMHKLGQSFALYPEKDINSIVQEKNQSMKNRIYTTRYYTEEHLDNIMKGVEE